MYFKRTLCKHFLKNAINYKYNKTVFLFSRIRNLFLQAVLRQDIGKLLNNFSLMSYQSILSFLILFASIYVRTRTVFHACRFIDHYIIT